MYSIKHAYQALDHGVQNVDVMYMDMRAYGKGFDGFWTRTHEEGARFMRGRPAGYRRMAQSINVLYEDTATRKAHGSKPYDLVVLANAVTPPAGLKDLAGPAGDRGGRGWLYPLQ